MKRQFGSYYPLALALLFGLAISFIPASSVLGDNITACQGSGSPTSSLKLGGRTITPTLILQAATGNACPTGETSLGLVTLSRTIIVSPVVTPTQNGTALLAAMTLISNSNPSASNPWLLKLEPGQYDLGSSALTLLPYVDLEGSGEDTTLISSTVTANTQTTATLVLASNSQTRFLAVANTGTNFYQIAIYAPISTTNTSVMHVTATSSNGSILGANTGLYNAAGSQISVQNSTFSAAGSGLARGFGNDGTANIQNSTLTGAGGSTINAGFFNGGAGSVAIIQNSTLTATGASSYAYYNINGTTNKVADSELAGGTGTVNSITLTCVGAYNANFVALNTNCQ